MKVKTPPPLASGRVRHTAAPGVPLSQKQSSLLNFIQRGPSQAVDEPSQALKETPPSTQKTISQEDTSPPSDEDYVHKRKRRSSLLFSSDEDAVYSPTAVPPQTKRTKLPRSSVEPEESSGSPRPLLESEGKQICKSSPHESGSSSQRSSIEGTPQSEGRLPRKKVFLKKKEPVVSLEELCHNDSTSAIALDGSLSTLCQKSIQAIEEARESALSSIAKDSREGSCSAESLEGHVDWQQWLLGLPIAAVSVYFREYVDAYFGKSTKQLPSWLDPENIRDSEGRRPDDSHYDVSTVSVPTDKTTKAKEAKHFTPALEQYWSIKKDHFDKIICFKIGKFYELFYVDAFIANRLCGLRWMGNDEKPHVGFPEVTLSTYTEELVNHGFKVVVVEQMETPKELEIRNKQSSRTVVKSKAVKRDICQVVSVGTTNNPNNPDSRLLLSIYFNNDKTEFAYTFCDVSTSRFWVGSSVNENTVSTKEEDSHFETPITFRQKSVLCGRALQKLKTLLMQIAPVEVILDRTNIPEDAHRILKALPCPPHINVIYANPFCELSIFDEAWTVIGSGFQDKNYVIKDWMSNDNFSQLCLILLVKYLDSMLLKTKVLPFARFEKFDEDGSSTYSKRLILDSASLRHLTVLQNRDGAIRGTLLEYLNHTVSPVGFRLLKRWLSSPLCDYDPINDRLSAVERFLKPELSAAVARFRSTISDLPDLERQLNRITTWGLKGSRDAVYFEDVHSKHFADFVKLLEALDCVQRELLQLGQSAGTEERVPARLKALTSLQEDGGSLCDLSEAIRGVKGCLILNETNSWTVREGFDERLDSLTRKAESIENEMHKHLKTLIRNSREKRSCSEAEYRGICFVHSKFPFEIEVPEKHPFWKDVKENDSTAEVVTSKKAGAVRFRTTFIETMVDQLDTLKQERSDAMYGCQQELFHRFYSHFNACLTLIGALAEIDVLMAFAIAAAPGISPAAPLREAMCKPTILPRSSDIGGSRPLLVLENSRHPLVAATLPPGSSEYITNNLRLGESEKDPMFFLVTGPNMGGKSTLLRQVCIAAIMAQLGSYVPATKCTLSLVDRIFTRIGAYDSLLEGKSTFLVEMEETATALKESTSDSLVVIDELGRGTATADGAAIAFAVAEYLAEEVKCRTLFSTHFQSLADELQRSLPDVQNVHMAALLDEARTSITFLYKLAPGPCPKSHGILVARVAGLPEKIFRGAAKLAEELEGKKEDETLTTERLSQDLEHQFYDFFKELVSAFEGSAPHDDVHVAISEKAIILLSQISS